jgi:hypothetical protein
MGTGVAFPIWSPEMARRAERPARARLCAIGLLKSCDFLKTLDRLLQESKINVVKLSPISTG